MYNQYPYSLYNPGALNGINPTGFSSPSRLGGLLSNVAKKGFSWDGFLTNTQRTLNVINQAMPIYNQVKPMFKNVGTVFRVIGELNSGNKPSNTNSNTNTAPNSNTNNSNPQFFA